jgi:hypothetical protein
MRHAMRRKASTHRSFLLCNETYNEKKSKYSPIILVVNDHIAYFGGVVKFSHVDVVFVSTESSRRWLGPKQDLAKQSGSEHFMTPINRGCIMVIRTWTL